MDNEISFGGGVDKLQQLQSLDLKCLENTNNINDGLTSHEKLK